MVKLGNFLVFIVLSGNVGAKFSEDGLSHLARLLQLGAGAGQQTKETGGMHVPSDVKKEKKDLDEQLQQIKHDVIRLLMDKVSQKRWIENDSSVRGTNSPSSTPQTTIFPSNLSTTAAVTTRAKPTIELPDNWTDFWTLTCRLHKKPFC